MRRGKGSTTKYYVVTHGNVKLSTFYYHLGIVQALFQTPSQNSGKCPGIYDDWEKLQAQIKDFKGAEYTSKVTYHRKRRTGEKENSTLKFFFPPYSQNSKKEAIELFHEKRPDWPKHRIPDFTIHASNR